MGYCFMVDAVRAIPLNVAEILANPPTFPETPHFAP